MNDLFNNPQKPKFKPKKCAECKNEFTPIKPLQKYCGPVCFWEAGKKKLALKEKKDWQAEKNTIKEKIAKLGDYEKLLEKEINEIVRLIDCGCKNCISCNPDTPIQKRFAGHFHSVGSNKSIRYNLHNIHRQCYSCNGNKGGNQIIYLEGLEREYGSEYAEYVHYDMRRKFNYMNWTKEDLKEWTAIARLIIKDLKSWGNTYDAKERIEMRVELNFRLGIYKTQQ